MALNVVGSEIRLKVPIPCSLDEALCSFNNVCFIRYLEVVLFELVIKTFMHVS